MQWGLKMTAIKNIILIGCLFGLISTIEGSLKEPLVPAPTPSPATPRLSKSPRSQTTSPSTGTWTLDDQQLRTALQNPKPYTQQPAIQENPAPNEANTTTLQVPKSKRPCHPIDRASFDAAVVAERLRNEQQLIQHPQENPDSESGQTYQRSSGKTPPPTTSRESTESTPRDQMNDSDAYRNPAPEKETFLDADFSKDSCCKKFGRCCCYPAIKILIACGIIKEQG